MAYSYYGGMPCCGGGMKPYSGGGGMSLTGCVAPTVPGVALGMLNTIPGLTSMEKTTLQQIKHGNDPSLNPGWGPNPYWGPTDMTAEALGALGGIAKNHKH